MLLFLMRLLFLEIFEKADGAHIFNLRAFDFR